MTATFGLDYDCSIESTAPNNISGIFHSPILGRYQMTTEVVQISKHIISTRKFEKRIRFVKVHFIQKRKTSSKQASWIYSYKRKHALNISLPFKVDGLYELECAQSLMEASKQTIPISYLERPSIREPTSAKVVDKDFSDSWMTPNINYLQSMESSHPIRRRPKCRGSGVWGILLSMVNFTFVHFQ